MSYQCDVCLDEDGVDAITLEPIPKEFIVRLSMRDGKCLCYDSRALAAWFKTGKDTCPLTRQKFSDDQIVTILSIAPVTGEEKLRRLEGKIRKKLLSAGLPKESIDFKDVSRLAISATRADSIPALRLIYEHPRFRGYPHLLSVQSSPSMRKFLLSDGTWTFGTDNPFKKSFTYVYQCGVCLDEDGVDAISLEPVPKEFIVRLSMRDGKCLCYDSRALAAWFKTGKDTCPLTRQKFSDDQIVTILSIAPVTGEEKLRRLEGKIRKKLLRAGLPEESIPFKNLSRLAILAAQADSIPALRLIFEHPGFRGNPHLLSHGVRSPSMRKFLLSDGTWARRDEGP